MPRKSPASASAARSAPARKSARKSVAAKSRAARSNPTLVVAHEAPVSEMPAAGGAAVVAPAPIADVAPVVGAADAGQASAECRTGRVMLGAACTIHEAPALRAHLLEQAALSGPYEIDGTGVEQIDTAGLQLVVAFALDCLERGIHYVWTGRSAALEDAIRVACVAALLESPGANSFAGGAA